MDRKIILWDIIKNIKRREYKNYHQKAIVTLDYNESLIVLISGGIDHVIYVWNPYIDTPVYCMKDHTSPITKIKFVDDPLHLLSLDSEGTMKVWNVRKLKCIYSFSVKSIKAVPEDFIVIANNLSILFYGKEINLYNYRIKDGKTNIEEN